jgi:hypothetical protein
MQYHRGCSVRVPPVPIPNTEVKPQLANEILPQVENLVAEAERLLQY